MTVRTPGLLLGVHIVPRCMNLPSQLLCGDGINPAIPQPSDITSDHRTSVNNITTRCRGNRVTLLRFSHRDSFSVYEPRFSVRNCSPAQECGVPVTGHWDTGRA